MHCVANSERFDSSNVLYYAIHDFPCFMLHIHTWRRFRGIGGLGQERVADEPSFSCDRELSTSPNSIDCDCIFFYEHLLPARAKWPVDFKTQEYCYPYDLLLAETLSRSNVHTWHWHGSGRVTKKFSQRKCAKWKDVFSYFSVCYPWIWVGCPCLNGRPKLIRQNFTTSRFAHMVELLLMTALARMIHRLIQRGT